ncbi:von Willebrand factor A domain-containing protein 2-like [Oculina patagonica]
MSTLKVLVIALLIVVSAADGMQISRRAFANWKALRGSARNSVQNAPSMCSKPIDVGIVMDKSLRDSSLGWSEFMQFARTLVSNFDISDDMTHIGAISFDQTAEILLKFNDLLDRGNSLDAVTEEMKSWRPGSQNEDTVIDQALELALNDLFTHRYGARGYDEVLVLLTYGKQQMDAAAEFARKLEQKDVAVLVVGFGFPDPMELWKIAGDPNNVFYVSGPDTINSVAEQVAQAVCKTA